MERPPPERRSRSRGSLTCGRLEVPSWAGARPPARPCAPAPRARGPAARAAARPAFRGPRGPVAPSAAGVCPPPPSGPLGGSRAALPARRATMKPGKKGALLVLLLLTALFQTPASYTTNAYVTVTFFDRSNNRSTTEVCECGIYGLASPVANAGGKVGIPKSLNYQACDPHTEFTYSETPWIALIERGNCTFSEKIQTANRRGAEAAVIYNVPESGNETLQMANFDGILYHRWRIVPDCCNDGMSAFMKFDHHPHVAGAGDIVSIMIGNLKGTKILQSIQRGIQVTMVIEVGKKHGPWMNHYSIFFVSVSFFIVTAATVGYFIFYSARRLRNARAQNRKQRQLKADAKRAIGKLQLRALKHGDKETGPDGDSCAVCIEIFRPNDIVRILTCNHLFHKTCIDPWLLEHRTCPMCKCDILKALGVEADVEAGTVSFQTAGSDPNINGSPESYSPREEDSHSETASSGYASVQGADEPPPEERAQSQNDHLRLVNHDASSVAVDVLPQLDNPAFEEDEPPPFEVPIYPNKF